MALSERARALADCVGSGGVAVFGADTVYGLACAPGDETAVARMYELKGRRPDKPSAVMYFDLDEALAGIPARTADLLRALCPGPLTAVLPDGRGIRVPDLPALAGAPPVLQTSANHAGDPAPRRLADVPEAIRARADLVLDAGELPGIESTVIDLRTYEAAGNWALLRAGALPESAIAAAAR